MKNILLLVVTGMITITTFGQRKNDQAKIEADYKAEAESMRQFVWGWKDPKFNVREIPAKYASKSKVIIARHTEFNAERRSKTVMYGLSFAKQLNQEVSEIVREVIKLNDKTAVDEYSELSFTQFERTSGFRSSDVSKIMVGVRVIKPDGKVQEINTDEVVLTQKSTTKRKAKLAVPDLTPGDIIDIYVATVSKTINDNEPKDYILAIFDDAPVMSYSFHAELGKKYAVKYRIYNSAPNLKVTSNAEEDIVLDLAAKDMDAFETSLWVSMEKQLPFVRMQIRSNPPKDENGAQQIKSNNDVIEKFSELAREIRYAAKADRMMANEYKDLISKAKTAAQKDGKSYKELTDEEKAAYLYYTLRYYKLLGYYGDDFIDLLSSPGQEYNGLSIQLVLLFYYADLEPQLIGSENRTGIRFKEAMKVSDLRTTAYIPSMKKYFYITSIFDLPFEVPEEIEGLKETRMFELAKGENESKGPQVPESPSTANAHLEQYGIKLQLDKLNVQVSRRTTMKGYYKLAPQRGLILFEDYDAQESAALGAKRDFAGEVSKMKNGQQKLTELRNAYAEARKEQQDNFLSDIKDWLGLDVKEMKDAKIENMGIRHTKPDFIYSSNFVIDGIMKKAGNNYIVEVGKLLGEPLKVKEDQRKRTLDIYEPYARSVEQEITIDVPDGYSVEGLNALNTSVKNETGYFTAEAKQEGSQVKISVKKHYLHNFEPAANFPKMNEFMDAASAWTGSKLLFKKK